jgi:hypothetical protein
MLGSPFNSLAGDQLSGFSSDSKPGCVIADQSGTIGDMVSGLETYSISSVNSQEEFFRQLDVNGKYKVTAMAGLVASKGSADIKTMSSIRINKNYSYILVKAKKKWQAKQIKKITVNPEALALIKQQPSSFFKLCGDHFVSSFGLVTEAYGVLECKSESREEKRKVDSILDNSVGVKDAAGADQSLQVVLDQLSKKTKATCNINVWQRGGRGTLTDKPETFGTSIVNYVANSSFDSAAITDIGTTPYKDAIISAELYSLLQGIDLDFKVPRSVIQLWQAESEALAKKMDVALDDIDNEKDPSKKLVLYSKAQDLVAQAETVRSNIERCSKSPLDATACRDSRASGEPWPDDVIIED